MNYPFAPIDKQIATHYMFVYFGFICFFCNIPVVHNRGDRNTIREPASFGNSIFVINIYLFPTFDICI